MPDTCTFSFRYRSRDGCARFIVTVLSVLCLPASLSDTIFGDRRWDESRFCDQDRQSKPIAYEAHCPPLIPQPNQETCQGNTPAFHPYSPIPTHTARHFPVARHAMRNVERRTVAATENCALRSSFSEKSWRSLHPETGVQRLPFGVPRSAKQSSDVSRS